MRKINFIGLKFFLKKTISFLRKRIFWIPPCLLIILLIYTGFIFYYYILTPPQITEKTGGEGTQLKMELYRAVVEMIDQREKILENRLEKNYRDIFR